MAWMTEQNNKTCVGLDELARLNAAADLSV
jgi:hypothetical protein